MFNIPYLILLI